MSKTVAEWKELDGGILVSLMDSSFPMLNVRVVDENRTIRASALLMDFLEALDFGVVAKTAEYMAQEAENAMSDSAERLKQLGVELKDPTLQDWRRSNVQRDFAESEGHLKFQAERKSKNLAIAEAALNFKRAMEMNGEA